MLLNGHSRSQTGVTLIELMIAIALVAVLLMVGLPEYAEFMRNSRIRNAAESTSAGLKLARAEAIRRNVLIRFDLTSSLKADCSLTSSASAWTISLASGGSPAAKCDTAPDEGGPLLRSWSNTDGARDVTLAGSASATTVTFTPMGRISPNTTAGAVDLTQIDFNTPGGGRNLRILIEAGGSTFMCDPNITSTADSRRCP